MDKTARQRRTDRGTTEMSVLKNSQMKKLLIDQREFSVSTFGPAPRLEGVHDHLAKEIEEVKREPDDITEWADCLLLSFDGTMRAGADIDELVVYLSVSDNEMALTSKVYTWGVLTCWVDNASKLDQLGNWKLWAAISFQIMGLANVNGINLDKLLLAARNKLEINKKRTWPDYRKAPADKAIEHIS